MVAANLSPDAWSLLQAKGLARFFVCKRFHKMYQWLNANEICAAAKRGDLLRTGHAENGSFRTEAAVETPADRS
jgi:hypothetical protein